MKPIYVFILSFYVGSIMATTIPLNFNSSPFILGQQSFAQGVTPFALPGQPQTLDIPGLVGQFNNFNQQKNLVRAIFQRGDNAAVGISDINRSPSQFDQVLTNSRGPAVVGLPVFESK